MFGVGLFASFAQSTNESLGERCNQRTADQVGFDPKVEQTSDGAAARWCVAC